MRILHVLSQRPGRTGSGVTLEAWVREAARRGHVQHAVVGLPASNAHASVGALAPACIHPLVFGTAALPFPLPGMSDVMPYESSRFSALDAAQLDAYRRAWRAHLARVVDEVRPDLIHAHHLWVLSSLLKDVAPRVPLVIQSHATGLRQMALCPHLSEEVRVGCRRAERVLALSPVHATWIREGLGMPAGRIDVVGAGYREDLFRPAPGVRREAEGVLFVGKYSRAKGLPWLLDAVERLAERRPALRLHLAGDAAGTEGRALAGRVDALGDRVVRHHHLEQADLARLMQRVAVLVLPSFYEGLPLVLVEAVAAGCRVVATRLPVVETDLAPHLGPFLDLVAPPRRLGPDEPIAEDLPAFVTDLVRALDRALGGERRGTPDLGAFTWAAAFPRVEAAWRRAVRQAEVAGEPGDR